jgi:hypothetical protein
MLAGHQTPEELPPMRRFECKTAVKLLLAAAAIASSAGVARADAIDGEWCLGGNHFAIDGPKIRTPGGNTINGDYSRHGFRYVAPAGESDAGAEVVMVRLNEETGQLSRTPGSPTPDVWRRCNVTS